MHDDEPQRGTAKPASRKQIAINALFAPKNPAGAAAGRRTLAAEREAADVRDASEREAAGVRNQMCGMHHIYALVVSQSFRSRSVVVP